MTSHGLKKVKPRLWAIQSPKGWLHTAWATDSSARPAFNIINLDALIAILGSRYPNGRHTIPKIGNLHLAWEYAQNPSDHHRFINMLRVTPLVFQTILNLIEEHPVFTNNSNNSQTSVEQQLAVTLYCMGQCLTSGYGSNSWIF